MSPDPRHLAALCLCALLAGCGMKGDLYLPGEEPPAGTMPWPEPSPAPPPDDEEETAG